MSEKNLISVKVGGTPYTIKTDEPAVNVERAAADVDRRISAHQRDADWLSTEKALALTAIELADRYLRLKDEVDNVNARYRETSKQLFYLRKETDELKQQLFLLQSGINEADDLEDEKGAARCYAESADEDRGYEQQRFDDRDYEQRRFDDCDNRDEHDDRDDGGYGGEAGSFV